MAIRFDLEVLIRKGLIPKEALDIVLCHFVKRHLRAQKEGISFPRYHFKVCPFTKDFRKTNRIILISPQGAALSLLKSQYAKKPKNPV
jgi:hypothetical protein